MCFSQCDLILRQRRWLEPLKDYDMSVIYHPRKANIVADEVIRLAMLRLERKCNTSYVKNLENGKVAGKVV